jgi:hypothetical protein
MIPPAPTLANDQVSDTNSSDDKGMEVASWALTIPYCAAKAAFAIAGSVVGGLGYAFSGGDLRTAEAVWTTSVYGTYILRPTHLTGEEPIHFLGTLEDRSGEPMKHASVTSEASTSEPSKKVKH